MYIFEYKCILTSLFIKCYPKIFTKLVLNMGVYGIILRVATMLGIILLKYLTLEQLITVW